MAAAAGAAAVVGGHRRSSVGSSPVRWLLHIMPLRIMRRLIHRHRPMGRGGGVTPRSLITHTHRLAPAGSAPFSRAETETKTRVDNISVVSCSFAFRLTPCENTERRAVEFSVGAGE
jgi:hypothetical protein